MQSEEYKYNPVSSELLEMSEELEALGGGDAKLKKVEVFCCARLNLDWKCKAGYPCRLSVGFALRWQARRPQRLTLDTS